MENFSALLVALSDSHAIASRDGPVMTVIIVLFAAILFGGAQSRKAYKRQGNVHERQAYQPAQQS